MFTDLRQAYSLVVENGVLNHARRKVANADATITATKSTLDRIQLGEVTPEQAVASGELKVAGKQEVFTEFVGLLDIVTP